MKRECIVIISGSYPGIKCGIGDYVERLTETLLSKNADIRVLTSRNSLVKKEKHVYSLIKRWNVGSLFKMLFFIKNNKANLINLHTPGFGYKSIFSIINILPLLITVFFKNIPLVITLHDFSISQSYSKIFYLPLLFFADEIILTNNNDETDIKRQFPFLKNRIKKIYMGSTVKLIEVPAQRKEELLKRIKYAAGERFIVTFGFIKPDRHLEVVIKTFVKLRQKDKKLRLLVIGDVQRELDKKYFDQLSEMCNDLGLQNDISWIGFGNCEEVSFYLSLSSVGILCYERGGGLRRSTLISCVLKKVPVVTNINRKYGIDADLLNTGIALTVDSFSADEIAEKAESILYNKTLSDEIKRKMKAMEELFNWENIANEILNEFSELIKTRRLNATKNIID